MPHWFTLILRDTHGVVDDPDAMEQMANDLFEAGCDDSTSGLSYGIVTVSFAREADSLREAVRSAIHDVRSAGYEVERVESNDQHVFDEFNAQIATGPAVTL